MEVVVLGGVDDDPAKSDRRRVALAGLGLIGAGAVLGLALAVPSAGASPESSRPAKTDSASMAERDLPDR